ncbi:MAG: hypothetical protein WA771_15995, partial [Chthoniobacterales bacterium]
HYYERVPEVEREAPKMNSRELHIKYGTKSTNPKNDAGFVIQMDYQSLDYLRFERGQHKYMLQLAVAVEKSTGCIVMATLFEHKLNKNTLNALLYNTLTFDSDPTDPTLLQFDTLEIDGESPNRVLAEAGEFTCALGIDVRIGLPRQAQQRGHVEKKHRVLQMALLPQLEAIIREEFTRSRSFVVKDADIEKVYKLSEGFLARFINSYNNEDRRGTGSRLKKFRDKFGEYRVPVCSNALRVLCKFHRSRCIKFQQAAVEMPSRLTVLVHNQHMKCGEHYQILHVRGSSDTFFVFDLDGTPLGRGYVLAPNTPQRDAVEGPSRKWVTGIKRTSNDRRTIGARRNLERNLKQPTPKEGIRRIVRSPKVAGPVVDAPDESSETCEQTLTHKPEEAPAPRFVMEDLGAFDPAMDRG